MGGSGGGRRTDLTPRVYSIREATPAPGRIPRLSRSVHVRGQVLAAYKIIKWKSIASRI